MKNIIVIIRVADVSSARGSCIFCILNMSGWWRLNRWHWEEGRTQATRTCWLVEWTKSQWFPWNKLLTVNDTSSLRQRERRQLEKRLYSICALHSLLRNNGLFCTLYESMTSTLSQTVAVFGLWAVGRGGYLIRV